MKRYCPGWQQCFPKCNERRMTEMNKIFIACPFIKYIDGTTFTDSAFRMFTERLYDLCMEYAPHVFLSLKREEYGAKPLPHYSCAMDLDELRDSDVMVALPDDSMGVAVEIGWMSAMKKPIILVLDKNQSYSPLVKDIHKITSGNTVYYADEEITALEGIRQALKSCLEAVSH